MKTLKEMLIVPKPSSIIIYEILLDWFGDVIDVVPMFVVSLREFRQSTRGCKCPVCDGLQVLDFIEEEHDPLCACADCEDEVLRDLLGEGCIANDNHPSMMVN